MIKLTTLLCILALAGCSHSERPAASADDAVTPNEAEARDSYGENETVTPSRSHEHDTGTTPMTPTGSPGPLTDFDSAATDPDRNTMEPVKAEPQADQPVAAPDNTGVNKRDRKASALTPMDQGSSKSDTEITQEVRQSVIDDGSLSFTAKNIKIITTQGKVTLRGPVNNAQERATIETKARRIAGDGRVDNQLEVRR